MDKMSEDEILQTLNNIKAAYKLLPVLYKGDDYTQEVLAIEAILKLYKQLKASNNELDTVNNDVILQNMRLSKNLEQEQQKNKQILDFINNKWKEYVPKTTIHHPDNVNNFLDAIRCNGRVDAYNELLEEFFNEGD